MEPEKRDHQDIFEEITNVESTFYQQGYQDGYDHGQLHGLFEGRELGREKGWEILEEVGFYEGWASVQGRILEVKGVKIGGRGKDSRALNHAKILIDLISKFPLVNPSESSTIQIDQTSLHPDQTDQADQEGKEESVSNKDKKEEIDMSALLQSIRARYRLLCSSLSVRPRLGVAGAGSSGAGEGDAGNEGYVVEGIEGPMKGVNTKQLLY